MQTSFVQLTGWVMAFTIVAGPARAQEGREASQESNAGLIEVTPFVSLGSTSSSRIGAAIRFAWTANLGVEAEVGYRSGEIDALSSNVSLLYDLPRLGRIVPYLAAGVGLEEYGTALEQPNSVVVTQPRVAFTVNAGGGLKVPVDKNWGVRTDARWVNGLGSAPENWRVYHGVTFRKGTR